MQTTKIQRMIRHFHNHLFFYYFLIMRSVYISPTVLEGHRSYKYHGFQDIKSFLSFLRYFKNDLQHLFPIVLWVAGLGDICKICVLPKQWGIYTLHMIFKVPYKLTFYCNKFSLCLNIIIYMLRAKY